MGNTGFGECHPSSVTLAGRSARTERHITNDQPDCPRARGQVSEEKLLDLSYATRAKPVLPIAEGALLCGFW